jgi:hypothetical protein
MSLLGDVEAAGTKLNLDFIQDAGVTEWIPSPCGLGSRNLIERVPVD